MVKFVMKKFNFLAWSKWFHHLWICHSIIFYPGTGYFNSLTYICTWFLQFSRLKIPVWIFRPAVTCKIQVWNRLKIKFIKLDISNRRIAKSSTKLKLINSYVRSYLFIDKCFFASSFIIFTFGQMYIFLQS